MNIFHQVMNNWPALMNKPVNIAKNFFKNKWLGLISFFPCKNNDLSMQ